jgi:hypothetical protein
MNPILSLHVTLHSSSGGPTVAGVSLIDVETYILCSKTLHNLFQQMVL